jgi:hypothetical protein
MQIANLSPTQRRSSRVPVNMPILVTGLEPDAHFSEICETMTVSAHGCAMRSPVKLEAGTQVHFHSEEGRQTTAHLVYCKPIEADGRGWMLGARLDRPENFWGLKACPADWKRFSASTVAHQKLPSAPPAKGSVPASSLATPQAQRQMTDDRLRALIAEAIQPLQTEVAELKGKLGHGEAKRSRFEVSLSQIPPELEQQLEQRLRKELWPRMLDQARQQSSEVLEVARAAIEQKTSQSHHEFLDRVTQELKGAEQRVQGLSATVQENLHGHLSKATAEFDYQVAGAQNRLKQHGEELFSRLQHSLSDEHERRRDEVNQLKSVVTTESARLQQEVALLDARIAALDEAARRLESGLEERLARLADEAIRKAQGELQNAVAARLKDLEARAAQELGNQIDKACSHLDIIQRGVEASVSESLRRMTGEALDAFENTMEAVTQESAARWRQRVAAGLNSLARNIGEEFQQVAHNESAAEEG